MLFSKTLIFSIFGLTGVGLAGSLIAVNTLTQPTKPNKTTLSEKCHFNEKLESLFSEIRELYKLFKSKYENLRKSLPTGYNLKPINDSNILSINDDSCFGDYWNLLYNLLSPLVTNLRDTRDPQLKALSELAQGLDEKIDKFYSEKEKIS